MITPRRTTLLRAPTLAAFRTTLAEAARSLALRDARNTFVLVPTRAAGEQLRRTIEDLVLDSATQALVLPLIGTRADLYAELASRLDTPPDVLSSFEREVLLAAAGRHVANQGLNPPFKIRPGLVAEMLALYDLVRRLGRSVADFERNLKLELERDREIDRGAEKLLQQTLFLAEAFRQYEHRLDSSQRVDEHGLRSALLTNDVRAPLGRIIVTVGDRIADADGVWPADFELLTRLPGLEALDVISTEARLAAGFLERLHGVLPDLAEQRVPSDSGGTPALVCPAPTSGPPMGAASDARHAFIYRDREDELTAVARRLKADRRAKRLERLDRTAVVVRRPLPYLYLARDVFGSAGVPFETLDTVPLAAEPYAAAVDLVLDAVAAEFTRTTLVGLMQSPHFDVCRGASVPPETVATLDIALADARYLGGLDRLRRIVADWTSIDAPRSRDEERRKAAAAAARAALDAAEAIAPLATDRPMDAQFDTLLAWLRTFDRAEIVAGEADRVQEAARIRRARVRAAVSGSLIALADAYRRHDRGAMGNVNAVSAAVRRWLGAQTFAVATGEAGVQIVDDQAARYGAFEDVQLVGLVDGEWPERARRNVLYPSSLLAHLEPLPAIPDPGLRQREAVAAARANFKDLVHLATQRVRLSTFLLENDAVVEPSLLLDEIESYGLSQEGADESDARVSQFDALALEPRAVDVLPDAAGAWARARLERLQGDVRRFQGQAGAWKLPRVSVSRLERYMDCPFRFFASEVLRLDEQPEDEDTRTPLERGRFLHDLFERFFSEWQRRGHGRVTPALLGEARTLFESICEEALATLTPAEAALERPRLLGSAVGAGIGYRVFAMEAERNTAIVERLLEYPLQGDFTFHSAEIGDRIVPLSAKADRIDLLEDGTLRVVDYKSKKTPDVKQALQLPIYSHCARVKLEGRGGRRWTLGEAIYLSFEGDKTVVPLKMKGRSIDELVGDAQHRLIATLDQIAAGRFPPRPAKKSLCGPCPYTTVCRLDYVAEDEATDG